MKIVRIAVVMMVLAACGISGNKEAERGSQAVEEDWKLQGLFNEEEYSWSLILYNTSDSPLPLSFASGQEIEVTIENEKGVLYRYSDRKMFSQALKSVTVPPGETRKWSEQVESSLFTNGPFTITFEILETEQNADFVVTDTFTLSKTEE
ncbi:BsuPI-related putative proteinase inhibitor [Salibacterium aidingense]|uniref:BsuPI-related putative proteinase inhibitor n=1 Tax=Salibacterium aidingense TaxID=384933 RepID=UPI003BBF2A77